MFRWMLISAIAALALGEDGNTDIKQHPFQVSLEENAIHKCSGALIRPNLVITAAQCTYGKKPSSFTVRAGTSKYESGGETAGVTSICQHEKYTSASRDYDLAVLLLTRSFTVTTSIKPVVLQAINTDLPAGTEAVVTGWRLLNERNTDLEMAEVTKMAHQNCIDAYPDQEISERMVCFRAPGKDCKTDFGAPLVRSQGNNARQLGLMSWGSRGVCGDNSFPAVYTDLANEELHQHIDQCLMRFSADD